MPLEAAVPILHAGGLGYWSLVADLELTATSGNTLGVQAALFRESAACSIPEKGLEKVA